MRSSLRSWAIAAFLILAPALAFGMSVIIPGPGAGLGVAPIGTPIAIGSNTAAAGTTLVITTTANAPAGSVIVVGCIANGSFTTIAVADGTNTYTTAAGPVANNNAMSNSAVLGGQLNSGSSITITSGATMATAFCAAAYVTGLSTATPDKTATASSNTVTTAALTQANEVAFGLALAYNGGASPGAVAMSSGFTILTAQTNYGVDHFSGALAYKIVAATTAVTFSWTASLTASQSVIATYKGN